MTLTKEEVAEVAIGQVLDCWFRSGLYKVKVVKLPPTVNDEFELEVLKIVQPSPTEAFTFVGDTIFTPRYRLTIPS
jgi:hypothetical protein